MLNKMIAACVGLILLALVIRGVTAGNGYLAEVERAAQQRQAVYQTLQK